MLLNAFLTVFIAFKKIYTRRICRLIEQLDPNFRRLTFIASIRSVPGKAMFILSLFNNTSSQGVLHETID